MNRVVARAREHVRAWARKRQGSDPQRIELHSRRIYIVPTAQGFVFGVLLFVMLIGSMNYNNSLGLALTFGLAGFALVVMHHCHRVLAGLCVACATAEPVFAGQPARFAITLSNNDRYERADIAVFYEDALADCVTLPPGSQVRVMIAVPTTTRGHAVLERFSIQSRYPASLFQAWAWINCPLRSDVYPAPAEPGAVSAPHATRDGSGRDDPQGDADFAGLREYQRGDSPRHIAWKSYARSGHLRVKQFAGSDFAPHLFEWSATHGATEDRLAQLCRWIVDANAAHREFGLTLPTREFAPAFNPQHVRNCLTALAHF